MNQSLLDNIFKLAVFAVVCAPVQLVQTFDSWCMYVGYTVIIAFRKPSERKFQMHQRPTHECISCLLSSIILRCTYIGIWFSRSAPWLQLHWTPLFSAYCACGGCRWSTVVSRQQSSPCVNWTRSRSTRYLYCMNSNLRKMDILTYWILILFMSCKP